MITTSTRQRLLRTLPLALLAAVISGATPPPQGLERRPPIEIPTPTPTRRDFTPPPLPLGADRVRPLTAEVRLRRSEGGRPPAVSRQVVTRAAHRIYVVMDDGREWFLEQNPVDPRRMTGTLVHHRGRTLVTYEDSDLRHWMGLRGWADALLFGAHLEWLTGTRRADQQRRFGLVFTRHHPPGSKDRSHDIWWSDEQLLPSHFKTGAGGVTVEFTLTRVRLAVDAELLRPPAARFPAYRRVDLAEWLER